MLGKFALNARVLVWFGNREEDKGQSRSLDETTKVEKKRLRARSILPISKKLELDFLV